MSNAKRTRLANSKYADDFVCDSNDSLSSSGPNPNFPPLPKSPKRRRSSLTPPVIDPEPHPHHTREEVTQGGQTEVLTLLRSLHLRMDKLQQDVDIIKENQQTLMELIQSPWDHPRDPLQVEPPSIPEMFPLMSLEDFHKFEENCDEAQRRKIAEYFSYICRDDINGSINAILKTSLSHDLCKHLTWTGTDERGQKSPEKALRHTNFTKMIYSGLALSNRFPNLSHEKLKQAMIRALKAGKQRWRRIGKSEGESLFMM